MKSILIATVLALSLLLVPTNTSSVSASDNYTFGEFTLEIEVSPPVSPPSGGSSTEGDGGGVAGEFTDRDITSADGSTNLQIPEGTVMRNSEGQVLPSYNIRMTESTEFPAPPENSSIIGLPYDLRPDGATFNPPLVLTFTYDPETLPDGITEDSLVLAFYDGTKWVELECTIDTENNVVTALVSHFTKFAVIGKVAVVVSVVVEPEPVPTVPSLPTQPAVTPPVEVLPQPTTPELPVPPVEPSEPESNIGWIIGGIVAVTVIAGVVFWLIRRKGKINQRSV